MPLVDLFVQEGRLDAGAEKRLGAEISRAVLGHEQIPDTAANQSIAWVYIHRQPAGTLLVGGEVADHADPHYRVIVRCQQGYLDDEHKQAVAADVARIIRDVDPELPTDVPRIFCMIEEGIDGTWALENSIVRAVETVDLLGVTDERIRSAARRLAAESGAVSV
ncbi:hypothetical protein GCM10023201_03520 [Actinomycetospora corticicola]|uniref:Phenylpyruvate tautomerase PptA (4-oxalocrotonate tautomerase family) n=1 Tax=Actinomycetospora corticicola TaxID=663602 RepID=A0A7Y9J958_9PSEU|nr:hypothetical protein [Actinomycetospora corticicola]NYD39816.1 phenylpyruvate tautomerase PptA (4-oxalocrotonate tautomerase family) [Actinomycetospora corticicola]